MVSCQFTLCGEASSKRLPGINPAGYDSQTGYQYDSISRVAGHRELAPPSNFSKLGGFKSKVFITSGIITLRLAQISAACAKRFRLLATLMQMRGLRHQLL